ncbi:GDSL-type esterase/lipase family protein [Nocardioides sp.]|uniref:GDSL-type esterase/lipase family protein n=1 Tax=Nocardioides sp. TaxID=35761 RepID=UPI00286B7218|nr:GDSL-type esterase/lipase family protein [Nocardioides sp.]
MARRARATALALLMAVALVAPGAASVTWQPAAATSTPDSANAGCAGRHWVGSWAAAPSDGGVSRPALAEQSLRMIVTPHLSGSRLRIRLTNRFGKTPITLGPVTIARQKDGPSVVAGSLRPVTFDGRPTVTIPAGEDVFSDTVSARLRSFSPTAVTVVVPDVITSPTEHYITRQTSYLSPVGSGDHAADSDGGAFTETSGVNGASTGWYFLAGIDVRAPRSTGSIVTFGDSITDGFQGNSDVVSEDLATVDRNVRYPDFLQRRLDRRGITLSVLNAGIGGNRILADGLQSQGGPSALKRYAIDALSQAGVTEVVVVEGINDIGQGHAGMNDLPVTYSLEGGVTAEQLIDGYRWLIRRSHRAGVRISLGTIAPSGGMIVPTYGNESADDLRREVNRWIRFQNLSDGVIDFDAAVRDPHDSSRIRPRYDGGDRLHFSPAGNRALASAVTLSRLTRATCGEGSTSRSPQPAQARRGPVQRDRPRDAVADLQ